MKEVLQMLSDFRKDRPLMDKNNDILRLMDLLEDEVQEAREAHPLELASEIADIVIYGLTMLQALTDDPEEEIKAKIAYNHSQHPANRYQTGDFHRQRKLAKDWAKNRNFREIFYSPDKPSE